MLIWRLVLGISLAAGLIGLAWLDAHAAVPGIWLMPVLLVFLAAGGDELDRLLTAAGASGERLWLIVAPVVIAAAAWSAWLCPVLAQADAAMLTLAVIGLLVAAAMIAEMVRYQQPGQSARRLASTALGILYLGVPAALLVHLRMQYGMSAVLTMLAVVKLGDVGAYTVGRIVGRRKLVPKISPSKTVEGAVGHLAFAAGGAYLCLTALPAAVASWGITPAPIGAALLVGLLLGVSGMLGDLAESLLKRDAGLKDSSRWLPGFGGVLDIIDSLLLAAPVAWLCWRFALGG